MLDHTGFVVSDLARARRFYEAIAQPLGLVTVDIGSQAFLLGRKDRAPPYLCGLPIGQKALGQD